MNDLRETVSESPPPASTAPRDVRPGQVLGGYELVRLLGRGGMGAVYLANQVKLDRHVVVKVIAPELAAQPEIVGRLHREARAAAKLSSENVVQVYDCDTVDGIPFIVMEYVDGSSLASELEKNYRFSPGEATRIALSAARGLKAAHDVGVLHRDVKPANLLLTKDGRVKVADFGLAKLAPAGADLSVKKSATLSLEGQILGTPAYMAPEQADGKPLDGRADIYALGVTYYELLTGELPFKGATPIKMLAAALSDPVPPPRSVIPAIPEAVENACLALMARNRQERPASIDAAIRLLEGLGTVAVAPSLVSGLHQPAIPPVVTPVSPPPAAPFAASPARSPGKASARIVVAAAAAPGPRTDWGLLAVAVFLITVIFGLGGLFMARRKPAPPPRSPSVEAAPAPSTRKASDPPLFTDDPEKLEYDAARAREQRQIEEENRKSRRDEELRTESDAAQKLDAARDKERQSTARERENARREQELRQKEQKLQAEANRLEDETFRRRADALATKETDLRTKESELRNKESDLRYKAPSDSRAQLQLDQTRREIDSVRAQLERVARDKLALVKEEEAALKRRNANR